jgi:hypothetical protein
MKHLLSNALIIARRDFMAVVATPTFLLFLLAPFLMLGVSVASGIGGAYLAKGQHDSREMVVIASAADAKRLKVEEDVLRSRLYGREGGPPSVRFVLPGPDPEAQQAHLLSDKAMEATAVMGGSLQRPVIAHLPGEADDGRYLALLAEESMRSAELGRPSGTQFSTPHIKVVQKTVPTRSRQQSTGSGTVVIMFMLTIMLASQAVGTLAEEKSNKVIEILAASVPLEAVFFGQADGTVRNSAGFRCILGWPCGVGHRNPACERGARELCACDWNADLHCSRWLLFRNGVHAFGCDIPRRRGSGFDHAGNPDAIFADYFVPTDHVRRVYGGGWKSGQQRRPVR